MTVVLDYQQSLSPIRGSQAKRTRERAQKLPNAWKRGAHVK